MNDKQGVMAGLEGLTWDDWEDYHSHTEVQEIARSAMELLRDQGQVKTAEWIYDEDKGGQDGWRCKRCGFFEAWYYARHSSPDFIAAYHYCPHCGAQMLRRQSQDKPAEICGITGLACCHCAPICGSRKTCD